MARPAGAFSVPVGAVLTVTALLTGVGLVLSEEDAGSLPVTLRVVPAVAVVMISGTCGIYLLLAAWSTFESGPGSAHPPARRLRLALFLFGLAASGLLVTLPAIGALIVEASGPTPDASGWAGAYTRIVAGAVVALVSGAGGWFLLRDERRRRARQRQRARQGRPSAQDQAGPHGPGRQRHHVPEQRRDGLPQRRP